MNPTVIGDVELSVHPHHPTRMRIEMTNALWFGDLTMAGAQAVITWMQAWIDEQERTDETPQG